ncbi:MAG TPA: 5-(carboxyamino)imidazole ribonucleotide synthase [Gammaproteobacteria bacterium]|nr:5-(carboxyamino)imidazole ribonucleotide synthase [Gammaproteobacteria bacterium]
MILPGATLAVLGGGQLGRMFTQAAHSLGYRVWVLDPDPDSPAGRIAERHLCTGWDDNEALQALAEHCAAVTTEFENVPAETLAFLEQHLPVRPGAEAVAIARDRAREKTFIRDLGLNTAPFHLVQAADDLATACDTVPLPALLKTTQLGYDGKGQAGVRNLDEAHRAFADLGNVPCILETSIALEREISVVLARGTNGQVAVYPVGENVHVNGILDTTRVPARIDEDTQHQAREIAVKLAEAMDYCGVLAVELFVAMDGTLLVNEMAPRPHNSGHYTLDACLVSQFEQQVRALCGLPLGATKLHAEAVMVNLLGNLWLKGTPRWATLLAEPGSRLHLYGKAEARLGRKMGHYTCLAVDAATAMRTAERLRAAIDPAAPEDDEAYDDGY